MKKSSKYFEIKERLAKGKASDHLFTVNSLSGGRTSSMMAALNEADLDIFAMVQTDDPRCKIKDPDLQKYVWNKLGTDLIYSTLESDDTLKSMRELEQYIGREIVWVAGQSLDNLISDKKMLPNPRARWCTSFMKLLPIFKYLTDNNVNASNWYNSYYAKDAFALESKYQESLPSFDNKVISDYVHNGLDIPEALKFRMNIGYRIDDIERVANFTESFDYAWAKSESGRNKWKSFDWRIGNFPVIQYTQADVISFWKNKPVSFPKYNNCEFCPNRPVSLIQEMFEISDKETFWLNMEKQTNNTFRFDHSLEEIKNMPRNLSLNLGMESQSMCNSGGCTD